MLSRNKGKKIITVLLGVSCVVSGMILASTNPAEITRLKEIDQIDSLINVQLTNHLVMPAQVRTSTVQVDSLLNRKIYRVRVPSRFSKTMFHIDLNKELTPYRINTPARIRFPSRDMNIYVYSFDTVLRTIHLTTDTDLDTVSTEQN